MTNPVTRPDRVSPADLDEAIQTGVERAEEADELSGDELDNAAGGITPGMMIKPYVDQA